MLYNAINKYGEENFEMEILEWCRNYNEREVYWIKKLNTLSPNGYNISEGGNEPPHKYGEAHHRSSVTESQVDRIIHELKHSDLSEKRIGELFCPPIRQCTVHNINQGHTHKREEEKYPIRKQCPYHLTPQNIKDIIFLLKNTGCPMRDIASHFNVNTSSIKHINAGRNHADATLDYPIRKNRGSKSSQPVETILANRSTVVIDTQSEMGICS